MAYYSVCPNCGNHLDPGEKCDCMEEKAQTKEQVFFSSHLKMEPGSNQFMMVFDGKEVEHE